MRIVKIIKAIFNPLSFLYSKSVGSTKINQIKKMNASCEKSVESLKSSTNSEKRLRIRNILKDKNEIINELMKDPTSLLKQKIAIQTLELIMVYSNILNSYYVRLNDIDRFDFIEVQKRINNNHEKSNNITNIEQKNQLEELIEVDTKLIESIEDEQIKLQNINGKLNYIESTIGLLKRQMLSNLDEEILNENVQNTINEAQALNNTINNIRQRYIINK